MAVAPKNGRKTKKVAKKRHTPSLENPAVSFADPAVWAALVGESSTTTGRGVSPGNSLRSTAVYAAVRVVAEGVAALPLITYQRQGRARRRADEHPLFPVLHEQPNPQTTSLVFFETLMGQVLLWGNAYAEIFRDGMDGPIQGLVPLMSSRMEVKRATDGDIAYHYRTESGDMVWLPPERVLHVPGLGFDGLVGKSPIQLARESVGLSLATEEFGAAFFGRGTQMSGMLEHPAHLGDKAYNRLKRDWAAKHAGLSNAHSVGILEEGMKFSPTSIPPEDAQFLETRKFQVNEIARIFRVPPHMIGDLDRATFSNVEQQSIDFVVHTLRPWLKRWEQTIRVKLFSPAERQAGFYSEFLIDGLLRGDTKSRFESYAIARQWGWMSADDIREKENQNPLPDGQGEIYLVPLNMVPADQASEPAQESEPPPDRTDHNIKLTRQLDQRIRVRDSHRPVFLAAANRLVTKEVKRIRSNGLRAKDWNEWAEKFYHDHRGAVVAAMGPPIESMADAIFSIVSDGLPRTGSFDQFVRSYVSGMSDRYVKAGLGQLHSMKPEQIKDRMSEWKDVRAESFARSELARSSNALAVAAFAELQVGKIRWVSRNHPNNEFCQLLDGRTAAPGRAFLDAGETLTLGDSRMIIYQTVNHPPFVDGCTCQVCEG